MNKRIYKFTKFSNRKLILYRDKLLQEYPNNMFSDTVRDFSSYILQNNIKLPVYEKIYIPYKESLEENLKESKNDEEKIFYLLYLTYLDILNGNFNLENFINEFYKIKFFKVLSYKNIRQTVENILLNINFDQLIDIFISKITNPSFVSEKEENQRLFLLLYSQLIWGLYPLREEWHKIYEPVKELYYLYIKLSKPELIFQLQFFASHIFLNLAQTQTYFKRFNEDFEKPLSKYIKNTLSKNLNLSSLKKNISKDKLKIGFVYDRIVPNSLTKVLYSLLKAISLNDKNFDLYVYDLEVVEKSPSDKNFIEKIKNLGINYVSSHKLLPQEDIENGFLYSHLKKTLHTYEKIVSDKIDILIMGNNRYQYNFFFTLRTAPVQIFWSHGNYVYDVEGIDFRIKHASLEFGEKNIYGYKFIEFGDPMDIDEFLNPPVDQEIIKEERKKYPDDVIILGTIGRLVKVNSKAYIKLIVNVMKKFPNTIYLACGPGDTKDIKEKIIKYGGKDLLNRWYFPGSVNPHIYGHIIDIWPNTFPLPQGLSTLEYMAKGGVFVTYIPSFKDNYEQLKKLQMSLYKNMPKVYAENLKEYNITLETLLRHSNIREKLSNISKKYVKQFYGKSNTNKNFNLMIKRVLNEYESWNKSLWS